MNKKLSLVFYIAILLLPVTVFAQRIENTIQGAPQLDVKGIFDRAALMLFIVFLGLVVIMFIWAGMKYLLAKGDPGKISDANKILIWAIVGVIVALLSTSMYNFITWFIGLS